RPRSAGRSREEKRSRPRGVSRSHCGRDGTERIEAEDEQLFQEGHRGGTELPAALRSESLLSVAPLERRSGRLGGVRAGSGGREEGDMLYMIIARAEAWSEGDHLFRTTKLSYQRMKRGFEACLRRNPDYMWDVNSYCYFACIANDRATAKELFKKIDGRWEK